MSSNQPGVGRFDLESREALVRITLDCLAENHEDMEKFMVDMRASSRRPQEDALLAEFERQMAERKNTQENG